VDTLSVNAPRYDGGVGYQAMCQRIEGLLLSGGDWWSRQQAAPVGCPAAVHVVPVAEAVRCCQPVSGDHAAYFVLAH
jgi:hypothetical protein